MGPNLGVPIAQASAKTQPFRPRTDICHCLNISAHLIPTQCGKSHSQISRNKLYLYLILSICFGPSKEASSQLVFISSESIAPEFSFSVSFARQTARSPPTPTNSTSPILSLSLSCARQTNPNQKRKRASVVSFGFI